MSIYPDILLISTHTYTHTKLHTVAVSTDASLTQQCATALFPVSTSRAVTFHDQNCSTVYVMIPLFRGHWMSPVLTVSVLLCDILVPAFVWSCRQHTLRRRIPGTFEVVLAGITWQYCAPHTHLQTLPPAGFPLDWCCLGEDGSSICNSSSAYHWKAKYLLTLVTIWYPPLHLTNSFCNLLSTYMGDQARGLWQLPFLSSENSSRVSSTVTFPSSNQREHLGSSACPNLNTCGNSIHS